MSKDVILKCRSFALNDDFFLKKSWSTSRSRWVAFLVAIYTKGRIETSVSLYLVSTVMTERDSRTVFGNMSKFLTVKATNNKFFVLFAVIVSSKNIYPLCHQIWANFRMTRYDDVGYWFSICRLMKSSNLLTLIEFPVHKLLNIFGWDKRIYDFYDKFRKASLGKKYCAGAARKDITCFFV